MKSIRLYSSLLLLCCTLGVFSQAKPANTDEEKIPVYQLPDPLISLDGRKISSLSDWELKRKPELMELFRDQVYGKVPAHAINFSWKVQGTDYHYSGGKMIKREVRLCFGSGSDTLVANLIIFTPAKAQGKVPVFLGYNFAGNHSISMDPSIALANSWVDNDENLGILDHKANEKSRGSDTSSWPIKDIIDRGYGVATMYYGDIDPDFDDGFQNGIQHFFYQPMQNRPASNEWGSIAAWAWGLSRAMDYLQSDPLIDGSRVIAIGHSRLGKTALWAAAEDPRFAMVVSNNSGCGGAALSKRIFGETVGIINGHFPHWFCQNFKKYNDKEEDLPVDQHELIALLAPRPVYIASASDDSWADPKGEMLGGILASPVYHLYGLKGLERSILPEVNTPDQTGSIAYHLRKGKHSITRYDWQCYMDFADKMIVKKN
jgi:hypothetical protein